MLSTFSGKQLFAAAITTILFMSVIGGLVIWLPTTPQESGSKSEQTTPKVQKPNNNDQSPFESFMTVYSAQMRMDEAFLTKCVENKAGTKRECFILISPGWDDKLVRPEFELGCSQGVHEELLKRGDMSSCVGKVTFRKWPERTAQK